MNKRLVSILALSIFALVAAWTATPVIGADQAASLETPEATPPQAAPEAEAEPPASAVPPADGDLLFLDAGGTCDQACQAALHQCNQGCPGVPGCFGTCRDQYIQCTKNCTC